jgi:hypothetical protein
VGVSAVGLAVAGLAVGLAAGCGASNGGGPAAATSGASGGAVGGFQAYVDCLRQHGVNIAVPSGRPSGFRPSERPSGVRPSGERPSRGPGGGGFPGFFGGGPPSGVDQATWDAAQQACASVRPSFGGGRNNGAITAYRNCLSDHGVTFSAGPEQLNTADPKVAAALAACAPLRPSVRPSPAAS